MVSHKYSRARKKMIDNTIKKRVKEVTVQKEGFNPNRLVNDETFETNLNAIIAYYQMTKGKSHGRFRAA